MYYLIGNDVEDISLVLNRIDRKLGQKVVDEGIPKTLDLYSKYDIEATFFMLGDFVQRFPESIDLIKSQGHEIACHSYSHDYNFALDNLSLKDQIVHLTKAKKTIEDIAGNIETFRAPALRINHQTPRALEYTGFKTDSSVASQRFDGPMTSGALNKLNWLSSPRAPYMMSRTNPFKKGRSNILEIPVSSLLFGFQGTTMRIMPKVNELLGNFLMHESATRKNPVNFLFHPNEIVDYEKSNNYTRRSKSVLKYLFSDVIRRRLKMINLGKNALKLKESLIVSAKEKGFEFVSHKRYRKIWRR